MAGPPVGRAQPPFRRVIVSAGMVASASPIIANRLGQDDPIRLCY